MHGVFRVSPLALVVAVVGVAALLVVVVAITRADWERRQRWVPALIAITVVGILGVTTLALNSGGGEANLQPGRTIRAQLGEGNQALGVFNVLVNVAMFIPLGWLLSIIARRRCLVPVIVGLGLSALLEVAQSLVGRSPDIDDVILNGLGAALGAGIAVVTQRLWSPR